MNELAVGGFPEIEQKPLFSLVVKEGWWQTPRQEGRGAGRAQRGKRRIDHGLRMEG